MRDVVTTGLILSSFVQISGYLGQVCISLGTLASNIAVVQRIRRWTKEQDFEDQSKDKIQSLWPTEGKISIEKMSIRYREGLPFVIKNLTLDIKAGEKVGILGRTGSGKSTLVLALLRILEIEKSDEGKKNGFIDIDGVKIDRLSLQTLRQNLVTIPQDPYLLEGTLKFNIDPMGVYSDKEVIESLKKVNFFETVSIEDSEVYEENSHESQLGPDLHTINNLNIEANGSNLSLGQRQLICIARALVKKPKILITDEATASIDLKTDQLIQDLIKTELKDTTVLTIAHRLNTIIEYDKIVVLKNGKKVEEGSPYELLESPCYFYEFVEEGGEEYLEMMKAKALAHYEESRMVMG